MKAILITQFAFVFLLPQALGAETLDAALSRVTGSEVEIDGHIGAGLDVTDSEAMFFKNTEGDVFPVILDAGRNVRKQLADCKFAIFGAGTPCRLKGKAEIQLDGAKVRLSLFETSEIGKPGQ